MITAVLVSATVGCGGDNSRGDEPGSASGREAYAFPASPDASDRPVPPEVTAAVSLLVRSAVANAIDGDALDQVARSGDPRLAWLLSDLLRFYQGSSDDDGLVDAFNRLTGVDVRDDPLFGDNSWRTVTDHLIAWDLPAPPRYRELKAGLFLAIEPRWAPFFADRDSRIDWRLVSWGGVLLDHRPLGDPSLCPLGCIPALDDPKLTPASDGGWYPDDRLVFGVVVKGDAVAFPKNMMEVHEMVNISIGGTRLGIPYCTLCGSAQAFVLDQLPSGVAPPVLRTSGLLSRSNKVMFDRTSNSVLDTFTGRALSGPLQDANVTLEQVSVVSSTWGEWKRAHPRTRIVARDGGLGRSYPADPLGGRDDRGPIFPVGDVDRRLPVQEQVVGVIDSDGTPVAFAVEQAKAVLAAGGEVAAAGVELVQDGGGLRARSRGGDELASHQAFWFAWSQFHPETELWDGD